MRKMANKKALNEKTIGEHWGVDYGMKITEGLVEKLNKDGFPAYLKTK